MKKSRRSKRAKRNTGFRFYLLVMVMIFVISTGVSYFYFRPMLAFKSIFIEDKDGGSRRLKDNYQATKEPPRRLYKSNGHAPSIWYDAEFRKDAVLVVAENVIRRYVKPYGVKLLDLYMDKEGIIYIDLSNGIRKNFKGDAFEEYSIIAGLYRSIRSSVPDFTALKILIEGRETESFGGHIDVSRPIGGGIAGSTDNI